MKGAIIAAEYHEIVWVHVKDGAEYACYAHSYDEISTKEDFNKAEQSRCINLSADRGDNW